MSWKTLTQAFKNKEMRNKLLFVLAAVLIFRLLSHIPVPLAEPTELRQLLENLYNSQQTLGFFDFFFGGALSNFSIVLLGLGPYITASIIMQLLTRAVPKLEALNQEGEVGRRKINQYTRLFTLPLAIMQSFAMIALIRQQVSSIGGTDIFAGSIPVAQWVLMVAALTGGAMLLMWLGELMSEQGVGNGISLLIFAGIVSQLPSTIGFMVSAIAGGDASLSVFGLFTLPINGVGLLFILALLIMAALVTYWVVKLNEAQRVVTVSYAKRVRGNRAYGGVNTVLPIKLITAGVIPIIFAVAFLAVPQFIGSLLANSDAASTAQLGENLRDWFTPAGFSGDGALLSGTFTDYIYPLAYFLLVVLFTYFYTNIMFNAKEISENLQKQGGFVPGIRPGKQTKEYLAKIVNRLNFFGAMSLGILAIFPFILDILVINLFGVPISTQLTIGGTGLLITVAVAIDTLRQIESKALMVTYDSPDE